MAPKARRGGGWVAAGGGMPLVLLLSSSGEGIDEFCEDLARRMQLAPLSHPNKCIPIPIQCRHACVYVNTHVCTYVRWYACTRAHIRVRVWMRVCVCACMYVRTDVFTYARICEGACVRATHPDMRGCTCTLRSGGGGTLEWRHRCRARR